MSREVFVKKTVCRSGDLETTALLATVYLMAVTRLTGSEAVRAVLADQLEPLSCLAEEVEGRLVDWEWEVAGLVRERLRLAMVAGSNQGGEQAWAEHRLELYYSVSEGGREGGSHLIHLGQKNSRKGGRPSEIELNGAFPGEVNVR